MIGLLKIIIIMCVDMFKYLETVMIKCYNQTKVGQVKIYDHGMLEHLDYNPIDSFSNSIINRHEYLWNFYNWHYYVEYNTKNER